jgi:hypothetical protein
MLIFGFCVRGAAAVVRDARFDGPGGCFLLRVTRTRGSAGQEMARTRLTAAADSSGRGQVSGAHRIR